ncbi:PilT domain-containing protein, partial [mine drainage metagenome]
MADYVLDSYAVLALLSDEAGAAKVGELLNDKRNRFWMSVVNLGEVYYIVARSSGDIAAEDLMRDIRGQENVSIVDATWDRVRG